jgi:hypothetical protein
VGREPVDFLVRLLFESTLMLGGCLAVLLFVLLAHWRRRLQPRPLLIGLALSVVLLVVQALVVTRREHADRIMARIEADVLASQTDAIAAALSTEFLVAEPEMDREKFVRLVERYMQRVDVRTLTRRALDIEASETDRFQLYVSYLADISAPNLNSLVLSRWRISFAKEDDGWRILSIEPTQLDRTPIRGWRGLRVP